MGNNYFKSTIIESANIHQELQKYIRHISIDESIQCSNDIIAVPSIPYGMTELVINLGNPYYRSSKNDNSQFVRITDSHIVGFKTRSSLIVPTTKAKAISILFKPGCLSVFVKEPLDAFTNKIIDAKNVFGPEFTFLEEQLSETASMPEQVDIVQSFLLSKLQSNDKITDFLNFIANMYNEKSNFSFKSIIARKSEYKTLERNFYRYIGTTPKTFHQIISFNYASKLISKRNHRLTEIAYDCNYYDQSHFIKKFKEFSGYTPKEYLNIDHEMVKFNQDIINSLF
ncbi:AraC family transcriptional regulator [Flavobacterium sp. J372]|uniref:helix-turn-helix domain-containing protein n=1 Tax=Flavobacterium sp. J372 TaxID=2898436 RepID=UPI0021513012|nr:AraC family transcriptional regulator [Flavobacterium sp. J372]MCR5863321.1 AraC family transcriptional regulator [Flavobacterium sp. J372]